MGKNGELSGAGGEDEEELEEVKGYLREEGCEGGEGEGG